MADQRNDEDTAFFSVPKHYSSGQSTPPPTQPDSEANSATDDTTYQDQTGANTEQKEDQNTSEKVTDDDTELGAPQYAFDEVLGAVHERALEEAGFGRLQWLLMVFLGLGLMGDGIELLLMAYILPGAEKDLCMNGPMKGWLGAIAFAGMMVGAILWGNLADKLGRKFTLLTSLSFNALFSILGAFMPDYAMFFLCRLLAGVGIGGSIPIVMAYFCEFCPRSRRGFHLGLILTFWVLGGTYVSLLGWLILPNHTFLSGELAHHSWRVFILACVVPVLVALCGLCAMPESPRYLLQVGRDLEALTVYRRLYKWNHMEAGADYEMPEIELPSHTVTRVTESQTQERSVAKRCCRALSEFNDAFFALFLSPLTRTTVVLAALWFSLAFGYYGLSIWFPEYMKKLQEEVYFSHTNITADTAIKNANFSYLLDNVHFFNVTFNAVSFTDVELHHVTFENCLFDQCLFQNVTAKKSYFIHSLLSHSVVDHTNLYADRFIGSQFVNTSVLDLRKGCRVDFDISYSSNRVYAENLLGQLAVLPATLISAVLLDKIGRVKLLAACLLLSATSVFLIWFTNTEIAVVCVNAVFNCAINGAFNAIDVATTELYPTQLRTSAFGFLSCLGRIAAILGNVAFGNLIDISKAIPILLIAVILSLGAMCSLKLPESKDKTL